MQTSQRNLAVYRVKLMTAESQLRSGCKRISTKAKLAAERWLDKKTSPYGGFTNQ